MKRRAAPGWLAVGATVSATLVAIGVGLGLGLAAGDKPREAAGAPRLVEEAVAAGLEHVYDGEFNFFVGGGVAVLDCDRDDRPDMYIAGGSRPAALMRNQSQPAAALRFARVPGPATDLTMVTGAYPLDVDGDGHVDLAVLRVGENVLLRGLGDCRFERANEAWSFDGGDAWTTAFSASWDTGAAWPTLALGNYLDESSTDNARLCFDNELVRPAAEAGFGQPVALAPGWCTLSMLFSDWDRTGRRDLRVSNDRHYYSDYGDGQEQLWRVGSDGQPQPYAGEDGWRPLRIWGMGIATADVTGDGFPEYFLTSQGDNKLQTLSEGPARPTYHDIALRSGVTAHRPIAGGDELPSTAWHAEFADVNNDGLLDLYVAKGNVEAQPDYAERDPNNLLLGQPDATFLEGAETAGIVHYARTRGAALADFNVDGMLDLVEVNRRENVTLWRNVGAGSAERPEPMGNWLSVRLRQAEGNVDALGAWVQVRVGERMVERELTVGGGHAGGQLGPLHFGLGSAAGADVRVIWPDGETGRWLRFDANQSVVVER
ncbi:MAG: CRTAC1 family protein [Chloroflexota bacterium]|nr:CRTAC1 family protein [Chloroflexota bacterium]